MSGIFWERWRWDWRKHGSRKRSDRLSYITAAKLLALILPLGLDTLSVAFALGIAGIGSRNRLRAAASFALFEGGMPLVGFFAGRAVSDSFAVLASIAGIVVLFGVGAWMIYEGMVQREGQEISVMTWPGVFLTSISVSLDELAIGFTMGALGLPLGISVILIATQAFVLTVVGTAIGKRIGKLVPERIEIVAGLVLAGLALFLVGEQLMTGGL